VEGVRRSIGADTLGYISLDSLIAATEQPQNRLCTACFTGRYPIPIPDVVGKHVLEGWQRTTRDVRQEQHATSGTSGGNRSSSRQVAGRVPIGADAAGVATRDGAGGVAIGDDAVGDGAGQDRLASTARAGLA
jgi:hypothetical protein